MGESTSPSKALQGLLFMFNDGNKVSSMNNYIYYLDEV